MSRDRHLAIVALLLSAALPINAIGAETFRCDPGAASPAEVQALSAKFVSAAKATPCAPNAACPKVVAALENVVVAASPRPSVVYAAASKAIATLTQGSDSQARDALENIKSVARKAGETSCGPAASLGSGGSAGAGSFGSVPAAAIGGGGGSGGGGYVGA